MCEQYDIIPIVQKLRNGCLLWYPRATWAGRSLLNKIGFNIEKTKPRISKVAHQIQVRLLKNCVT